MALLPVTGCVLCVSRCKSVKSFDDNRVCTRISFCCVSLVEFAPYCKRSMKKRILYSLLRESLNILIFLRIRILPCHWQKKNNGEVRTPDSSPRKIFTKTNMNTKKKQSSEVPLKNCRHLGVECQKNGGRHLLLQKSRIPKKNDSYGSEQCCGSVTFWYGSGSAPLTNRSGSGSSFFSSLTFKTRTKKYFFQIFSAYYFLKVHKHHFSK